MAAEHTDRLHVLDLLRGIALILLCILHFNQNYNCPYSDSNFLSLSYFQFFIHKSVNFLAAGKAYALFALLFGISIAIQLASYGKKYESPKAFLTTRAFILFSIGIIHSALYQSDFISYLSLMSVFLVIISGLTDKFANWIGLVFLAMPFHIISIILSLAHNTQSIPQSHTIVLTSIREAYEYGSLIDVINQNIKYGLYAKVLWLFETGRGFQTMGLTALGFSAYRSGTFRNKEALDSLCKRVLLICSIVAILLYSTKILANAPSRFSPDQILQIFNYIEQIRNTAQMLALTSAIYLIYDYIRDHRLTNLIANYGRCSLTAYILQSLVGVPLFYKFGLFFAKYSTPVYSTILAVITSTFLLLFCNVWLKHFKQGPIESLLKNSSLRLFGMIAGAKH